MCWSFSRAQVVEYFRTTCKDTGLSALLSLILTADMYSCVDKTKDSSRPFRFGMTCELLTGDLGEELLTAFRAVFRVKTSQQQAMAQASLGSNLPCGLKCCVSFARLSPDMCSWRTPTDLFGVGSPLCSKAWPNSGTMRNGVCYRRDPLELRTYVSDAGCSVWPTPISKRLDGGSGSHKSARKRGLWITPSATDATRGGTITDNMSGGSLTQQINTPELWPTPTVHGNNNRQGLSPSSGNGLATVVKLYPTPRCNTGADTSRRHLSLDGYVKIYPTPTAHDSKNVPSESQHSRKSPPLVCYSPGHLNPDWVEWLMGWPIGWTDLHSTRCPDLNYWIVNQRFWFEREIGDRTTQVTQHRVARIRALGNGQVPLCAAVAFAVLFHRMKEK